MKLTNRSRLLTAILCMLPLTGGCGPMLYFFWPFGRTVTIPAEFDGLEDRTVALVVFAGEATQYEYPRAGLDISAMTSVMLGKNVDGVTTVDPMKVTAYQSKNRNWAEMDRTALGKALEADFVMLISLVEFTTVETGYVDLLRGRINAEVKIFDCSKPEQDAMVWTCLNIRIQFPETPTVRNARNEAEIRTVLMAKFSDELTKKFYSHTVDREDL